MRKIVSICMTSIIMLSIVITTVGATEPPSVNLNGEDVQLIEICRVENGVTYLPIRMFFNTFKDKGFSVQVVPSMSYKNIAISVLRPDPSTGDYNTDRRGIFVRWDDRIVEDERFPQGRIDFHKYIKTQSNGNQDVNDGSYDPFSPISNALIISRIDDNGGQRVYMSVEDLNKIVQFLVDDSTYVVTLK